MAAAMRGMTEREAAAMAAMILALAAARKATKRARKLRTKRSNSATRAKKPTKKRATRKKAAAGVKAKLSPQEIKKALGELKKINPKAAEIARRGLYEANDYRRAVGTVQQARELADTFESLGGSKGILDMQEEVRDYAQELTAMGNGDPTVIDDLARDFPQGLVKLVPHALDKLQAIDPGAYEHLAARVVFGNLSG